MAKEEIRRRTAKVHTDTEEVIVNTDGAVKAVATAVQEVNETLSIHAAWTDERFDQVDRRLLSLQLGQGKLRTEVREITTRLDTMDLRLDTMDRRVGVLEVGQTALRQGQDELHHKVDHLTARVEEVLAFAIRRETRADEIDE